MTAHAPTEALTAVERLSPMQRFQLEGVCASFAMEDMEISEEASELGARFILDEITGDELVERMRQIGA